MNSSEVERALRSDAAVLDCAVVAREARDGTVHHVAYVVPRGPLSVPRLLRQLTERFGDTGAPDALLRIPAIPYTAQGHRDDAALRALPVPDALLLAQAEESAASALHADRVASVGNASIVAPPPLHLSDVLPAWRRFASAARTATAAAERIAPTGAGDSGPLAIVSGGELDLGEDAPRWLGDLLVRAARQDAPSGLLFHDDEGIETFITYAELYASAQRILGGLQAAGVARGAHLVFHFRDNRDFFETFWACILGCIVPVPTPVAPSYADVNGNVRRLGDACGMLDRAFVATSAALVDDVRGALRLLDVDARILAIESLRGGSPAAAGAPASRDDVALMMLTSGSTGRPKGVPLRHRNLLARSAASCRRNRLDAASVSLNWMPLDHVAGLILVHLRDMWVACRQVHVATEPVLRDPLLWIDLMDRHRATATFAPNFAYGLVSARSEEIAARSWDLSCVRRIVNGGEAIVAASARKFLRVLAPHGLAGDTMVPAWGMSETSSGVTYSDTFRLDTIADSDAYVPVGPPLEGVKLRIVDEADQPLREGQVGHLQVAGETLFPGYFGDRPPREEVFTRDGWFRTGDLARLDGGVLSITGRAKDIIIVNGANYSGAAIEDAVDGLPGVVRSFTAACGVPDPRADGGEGLAIFFVPAEGGDEALAETLRAIRQRLVHDFSIAPAFIVPLDRGDVPKTSIGKIQRTALQKALEAGQYEAALKRVDVLTGNANTLPAWFFRHAWMPRVLAHRGDDASEGGVLVFGGPDALSAALAEAFAARGLRAVMIDIGARFEEVGPSHFRVDPDLPEDIARLIQGLGERDIEAGQAVYLWNARPDDASAGDECTRAARACARLAVAVSALQALNHPLSLTVVSNGVANVTGAEGADIARGTVAALVHSIAREFGGMRARHLDCGDMSPAEAAATVVEEMRAGAPDDEVAYRVGTRWVPSLVPLEPSGVAQGPGPLRRGGRYVVTGGLGGVGSALVAFLLREYDAQVLVVGRGEPSAALERLRDISPRVSYARADVGDARQLLAAVAPVLATWDGPLTAAFHLAVGFHESSLRDENEGTLREAFHAKIAGANALLELLGKHEGAALVAFSSIVGIFGGAGVGAYAAASRYLDALAGYRGSTPVYTLDWSAWHQTGLNRRFGASEALRAMGGVELEVEHALASLQVALSQPVGEIAIGLDRTNAQVARHASSLVLTCRIDVFYEGGDDAAAARRLAPLRDRFGAACAIAATRVPALPLDATGDLDIAALESVARHGGTLLAPSTPTEQALWDLWRRVLGVDAIGVDQSFFELGGQSLLATQLLSAIAARYPVPWTLRDIFAMPTIAEQASRIDALESAAAEPPSPQPASGAPRQRSAPLSPGQQRLWFLDRIHPANPAYHISATARFDTCPDPDLLRRCLHRLAERHESLRTRFPQVDREPRQWIEAEARTALAVDDVESEAAFEALLRAEARRPFDLQGGPLWRARLARLPGGRGALVLSMHHIVVDGWSMKVLFGELLALVASGAAADLPPLALQCADCAAALDESVREGRLQAQVDYWRMQLGSNLHGFSVPADRPRPSVQTYAGARLTVALPAALARRTRALARQRGVTLFVTLLAAYKAMLARYAQQHDIIVGTVFANRNRAELEGVVGFMVNLLAMRTDLGGNPRFVDILQRVQRVVLDGHAHADVPFELLLDVLQPPRDTSRSPLFQVAFDVRDPEITRSALDGVRLGVMEPDLGAVQYDLHLTFAEDGEDLTAIWYYNTDLFLPATIERMAANYVTLLQGAVDRPEERLSRLPVISSAERDLIMQWNLAEADFARDRCLQHLFEEWVDRQPDSAALWYRGASTSYRELDERANRLAHRLRSLGVARDAVVGVSLERSPDLVVAILAILKAGGAYLPLDPTYPAERLEHMLSDSGARLLLTRTSFAPIFEWESKRGPTVLALEGMDVSGEPSSRPGGGASHDLAYMIYTSGSTGKPKGVEIEHHGWCNVAQAQHDLFGLRPGMRVVQFASLSFDASAFELSMALANGGTLVLGDPQELMPGPGLARLLREAHVNVITVPPSSLAALDGDFPDLRVITVAGEACPASAVERWARPPVDFFNLYGPTETTIWASWTRCEAGSPEPPPIGRPVPNLRLYVLDGDRNLLPVGMPGELYIGGEGVARGYRGRPELQAERFVRDPFSGREGARMYRSGDLVRQRADGQLEFLGRCDHQVKIRGFRIELGEIDAVMRTHPAVQEVVAMARAGNDGEAALVAYVSPRGSATPSITELRQHLQASLPGFMIPSRIVVIDRMPLLPNGKVDRGALPDPDAQLAPAGDADQPQNEMERLVADVWQRVLGLPSVDRRQNFFEAGGHSLKMARVHALLSERLGRSLSLLDLFRYPTVASLAAHLARRESRSAPTDVVDSTLT